ncbi:thioredoxin-like protein 1 [Dermatophagoides farinae]|uniref:Thioredoxin-like protein 1 n=1 Tax=Dermatophagoides farinae TaxID=6954 RepID=A0A9D4P763_DERFA|nr:thioredoxin-like protein 1 [Dermatophagoides farinae]
MTILVTIIIPSNHLAMVEALKRRSPLHSDVIEEVEAKRLDGLIQEQDYIAVFFYTRTCDNCKDILEELEKIDDDANKYGVEFVKNSERAASKKYGINQFPTLVYFRHGESTIYEGDLMNEEEVLEWLISVESMDLPDRIEEVNAKILQNYIDEHDFVAVLFYKKNHKKCDKVLLKLEEIDDDADQKNIGFVKISDETLAYEYGLEDLPSLVYYRKKIPIVYTGDLENEKKVLDWLIEFRDTVDDPDEYVEDSDEIEDVSASVLQQLIENTDALAVLFYDDQDEDSMEVLQELENIDDECDQHGIAFVKIDDIEVSKRFGIEYDELPTLVYFEEKIPNFYQGDLMNEEKVLQWLIHQKNTDEIEDVSDTVLENMIDSTNYLAVLFYDQHDKNSQEVLKELENIDDECDEKGIAFVKIDDDQLAETYGLHDELPSLVYFENRIPSVYQGDLRNEEQVLEWLIKQQHSDEIEEVSHELLNVLIQKHNQLAALIYKPKDKQSEKVLKELEHIDDECDDKGIVFVKTDDVEAAEKYGVRKLPVVLFFKYQVPTSYNGDLTDEDKVLEWLLDQQESDQIEQVNSRTLKGLIDSSSWLAVLFFDQSSQSQKCLKDLETIDDDADRYGIPFVKIDDVSVAKDYGLADELPVLVYFENRLPTVYEGDLTDEDAALAWLVKQRTEDTIEEVTEEILADLLKEREYVLVYFAPNDCKECEHILHNTLEHIDDDTDEHGILFVTTDDLAFLQKQSIKVDKYPVLVLFRNGEPIVYRGNLKDGKAIMDWLTDDETLDDPDEIEEVNERMLDKILDRSVYVAVLFSKDKCSECEKVLQKLESIDHLAEEAGIDFVRVKDLRLAKEYNIVSFPALVLFRRRIPLFYEEGSLKDADKVLKWLVKHKDSHKDVIELVDRHMLQVLLDDVDHIVVFFYDEHDCEEETAKRRQKSKTTKSDDGDDDDICELILHELENIDDDTDQHGIHFVKIEDGEYARELGITQLPSLVYFEDQQPSIYDGDLLEEEEVLEWLIKQKNEDTIENVNREILFRLIAEREYLAVFFYKPDDDESAEIAEHLEKIDDDCGDYDVALVKCNDQLIAKKYGIRNPPGLVFFRRGKHIRYEGNLFDEDEVLEWLTRPDNMEMSDAIEKVNRRMFERMLDRTNHLAVLFYSKVDCKNCDKVLEELEKIDDEADAAGVKFVKIEDNQLAKEFGVYALPALVFFKKGEDVPVIFAGDLKKSERILEWLINQKDPSLDRIEEVDGGTLRKLIESADHLAVYFYVSDSEECQKILEDLENIDTETDRHAIILVKTQQTNIAKEYGIEEFPALIYFEKRIPSIYEGDISAEEDVLQWLIQQKTEDTIESVNRELLEQLITNTQYLVVYFYKPNCRACDIVLEELENIDDDCEIYGINFVKIQDQTLAKRYGIKNYPALVYFRNGNPLIYDDDLRNEEQVFEWLIEDENRELADEIEEVNGRMLEKLIHDKPFLAVLFYGRECAECQEAIEALEEIDDDVDIYGFDFVKINDPIVNAEYNVQTLPSLALFRKSDQYQFYEGDLNDQKAVLEWLTSNEVFEIKDEIEEVNRRMLEKIINENDFVAVYFYETECYDCESILNELEHIDDDTDQLDIMFVKIRDTKYARKYGIQDVPALVFFRKRFPSIYRGDLIREEEVLEWLKRNRYRHPELNFFMYAITAITGAFILYTLFLIFCIRPKKDKSKQE